MSYSMHHSAVPRPFSKGMSGRTSRANVAGFAAVFDSALGFSVSHHGWKRDDSIGAMLSDCDASALLAS
jgi:hypothetical protein